MDRNGDLIAALVASHGFRLTKAITIACAAFTKTNFITQEGKKCQIKHFTEVAYVNQFATKLHLHFYVSAIAIAHAVARPRAGCVQPTSPLFPLNFAGLKDKISSRVLTYLKPEASRGKSAAAAIARCRTHPVTARESLFLRAPWMKSQARNQRLTGTGAAGWVGRGPMSLICLVRISTL